MGDPQKLWIASSVLSSLSRQDMTKGFGVDGMCTLSLERGYSLETARTIAVNTLDVMEVSACSLSATSMECP